VISDDFAVAEKWYARRPEGFLYDQPRAAPWQVERARTLLEQTFAVPLDDFDAHLGALTILNDGLRDRLRRPVRPNDLVRQIQAACGRPGFEIRQPRPSHHGKGHWRWIDPRTIARGALGERFSPYHDSVSELAVLAQRLLLGQGDPDRLVQVLGHPRTPEPAVVVNSIPGPWGPVRPVTVNGNHRTLAFEALGAPLILAKVHSFRPPYRIQMDRQDDWPTTLEFLRWLASFDVVRLSSRAVVREGESVHLRVAEAPVPWLAAPPRDAWAALTAYEAFYGRPVERFGRLDRRELERQWGSAAGRWATASPGLAGDGPSSGDGQAQPSAVSAPDAGVTRSAPIGRAPSAPPKTARRSVRWARGRPGDPR
jgi:hypothetical protein